MHQGLQTLHLTGKRRGGKDGEEEAMEHQAKGPASGYIREYPQIAATYPQTTAATPSGSNAYAVERMLQAVTPSGSNAMSTGAGLTPEGSQLVEMKRPHATTTLKGSHRRTSLKPSGQGSGTVLCDPVRVVEVKVRYRGYGATSRRTPGYLCDLSGSHRLDQNA